MAGQYKEYEKLNLPEIGRVVLDQWKAAQAFQKSIDLREGKTPFVFYEGTSQVQMVYLVFTTL